MVGVWAVIGVAGLVAYYAADLRSASDWKVPDRPPNIQILAVDGRLIGNRGDTGGEAVALSELPPYVPNAVIAIEDRRFRSHYGVDPIGVMRALVENVATGGRGPGGSTLTQQLAKNMFLTPERSLKRKVQEVILSLWLERKYTKDQILEMYLNRVYFGSGAYGIEAAAMRYFNTDARDLTLAQASTLAGVLPAPSRYAPNKNPEAARQRQLLVLAAMKAEGFITAEQEKTARDTPVDAENYHANRSGNYIADWVMELLPYHLGAIEQDVVVETTVDLDLQAAAEKAVASTLDEEGEQYRRWAGRARRGRRHRRRTRARRRALLCRQPVRPRHRGAPAARLDLQAVRLPDGDREARLPARHDDDRRAGDNRRLDAAQRRRKLSRTGHAARRAGALH